MRHQKKRLQMGRTAAHRKAMLANMASSLITYERIQTTDAKAKALRPFVEKLLTLGKRGPKDLHARRVVMARLRDADATARLFDTVAPRFVDRPGGYTRIVKVGTRTGDAAPMSIIEFVGTTLDSAMSARGFDEDVEDTTEGVDDEGETEEAGDEE